MIGKRLLFVIFSLCLAYFVPGKIAWAVGPSTYTCSTAPNNPINNCGFETGDFTGWVTQDLANPFYLFQVVSSGTGLPGFTSNPTEGTYSAAHGFDGQGPGTIKLGQDVTLPTDSQKLTFDYRAEAGNGGTQNRTFIVSIEPAGGGTPLQTTTILTVPPPNIPDTGILTGIVNVSSFAGQTVRISFSWYVPEPFTGPGSFELDNITVLVFPKSVTCDTVPNNPINNCGFETGDFTGWVTQDLTSPFFPLSVVPKSQMSMIPAYGNLAAVNGFEGNGPGTIKISQDVSLPSGSGELTFDYRASWNIFPNSQNRTLTVTIEPAGGGTPLQTTAILTAPVGQFDTWYLSGSVNVRSFAGQTVRISFNWYVPEINTGPADFLLDNVAVVNVFPWPMFLPAITNNTRR